MYLILTSSKDTYITNKIIDGKFRATDANVGRAGTIDLFKLYDESTLAGEDAPVEISRALIKFDIERLKSLTGSILDVTNSTFKCTLKLKNILAGHATPSNFRLAIFPLSKSFDEGIGRDVLSFSDIDGANFITASYSNNTITAWELTGANKPGLLGSSDIDYISSGNLGASGVEDLGVIQHFVDGDEDLHVDVTKIISGVLMGVLPDHGFRLAFSGSEETDTKTRFVKRFASRHSRNRYNQPQLHVSFDDTLHDHHESFFFDVTGSLFLNNFHRGAPANIVSGSGLTQVVGSNSLIVRLMTGSYTKYVTASQHTGSTTSEGTTGVYSATFALPSSTTSTVIGKSRVTDFARVSGSLTFDEFWEDGSGKVGYYTGSLTIKSPSRTAMNFTSRQPLLKIINARSTYTSRDKVRFRLFVRDYNDELNTPVKTTYKTKSVVLQEVYYRVRDADSGDILIPYEKNKNGTRLSSDSEGMFFDFYMYNLFPGRVYTFDFFVKDRGVEFVVDDVGTRFRLDE